MTAEDSSGPPPGGDLRASLFERVPADTRILLVEDSELQAKVLIRTFEEVGFSNVRHCSNATEAMQVIKEQQIQLVFCDWNMPEKSGLDLLQEVRADSAMAKLPFILVTAHSERNKVIRALKNGVSDYIVKPLSASVIEQKLMQLKV